MMEIQIKLPGQASRVQRFSSTVITVGRATDCELCVDDPSISRRHCRISRAADGWVVEDLGSANGTAVAGRRIAGACAVAAGASITLGDLMLQIVVRGQVRAAPARSVEPVREDMSVKAKGATWAAPAWLRVAVVGGLVIGAVGLGGWTSARAWDRPLRLSEPVTQRCRPDDPLLLAADAAADAAALEVDAEAAVRAGLRAYVLVKDGVCGEQSRAGAGLRAGLSRLGSQRLGQHPAAVRGLAVAEDTRVVALDEDGGVMVWDRARGGHALAGVHAAQAIARSPEGRWLAVGEVDGRVRWVDLEDEAAPPEVARHGSQAVSVLAFARDGRMISGDVEGRLRVWRAGETWQPVRELRAWAGVTQVALAGEHVLAFGVGRAMVWPLARAGAAGVALMTGQDLTAAALDDSGMHVVVGDAGGVVTRWSLGRRPRPESLTAHAAEVRAVAWVGDAVASVGADDALRVAELGRRVRRGGPPLVLVADTPVPVDSLVVTGGGRWLVGAGVDGGVVTWDLQQRNRRLPASLRPGHRGTIGPLVAGAGWVVSGGLDGVVRAWDMSEETAAKEPGALLDDACHALGWSEPGCA